MDILQVAPRIICVAKLRLSGAREDLLYAEVTPALELLVAHDQLAEEDLLADELKLEVALGRFWITARQGILPVDLEQVTCRRPFHDLLVTFLY